MIDVRRGSRRRVLAPAILVLSFLCAARLAGAATPRSVSSTWSQAFGPGSLSSFGFLVESPAGPVFAGSLAGPLETSSPLLLQEDEDGQVLWQRSYGSLAEGGGFVGVGQDGGFFIDGMAGTPEQPMFWLASLDAGGAIAWQESVSAPPYRGFVDSAVPSKDGFFLLGTAISPLFQSLTPAIVKLSTTGRLEWQWTYKPEVSPGGGGDQYAFSHLVPLEDGGAMVAGTMISASTGEMNILLLRIGGDGLILWQMAFGGPDDEFPTSLALTDDGGVLLAGTVVRHGVPAPGEDSYSAWLLRLDDRGSAIWQVLLSAEGAGLTPGACATDPAGGFLLTGFTGSLAEGNVDAWAGKLDAAGNLEWQKSYGGPGQDWALVSPDPAGGYLLQGTSAPEAGGPSDFWLAKLDGAGEILWQRSLGGAEDDWAAAGRLSDGRVLVSGISPAAFGPDSRSWTVVLDPDGGFGAPCAWVREANLAAAPGSAVAEVVDGQPSKPNLAQSTAPFSVGEGTTLATDEALVPEDLCPPLAPLAAAAEADLTAGVAPLTVHFTGDATGGAGGYAYAWDFGDGTNSTDQNPAHTFTAAGEYAVRFTVTDSLSQTAADDHLVIHATGPLAATAQADATAGDVPLTVHFGATVTGGTEPYAYNWDFGDGTVSNEQNPSHTYTAAGAYSVAFFATDGAGGRADATPLAIAAFEPLAVALTVAPTSGVAPLSVAVVNIVASGGDGHYVVQGVDWGDGQSGLGGHTYANAGTFQAKATVTDGRGASATSPPVAITVEPALAAAASADVTSGTVPLTVHFIGSASGGAGGYAYSWDFGDGGTSSSQNPEHTYAAAGSYSAVLTVTDSSSHSAASMPLSITAVTPLLATASADATSGSAPLAVHFTGVASGGTAPYAYAWDFGDSSTSVQPSPSHTYAAAGTYHVTLAVTDSASRAATDAHLTIEVAAPAPPPVISMIKKAGSPFRLIVTGSNLQSGIRVFINGTEWTSVQYKNATKFKLTGGSSLKAVVPKGVATDFTFVNPDGGAATVTGWSY